MIDFSGLVLVPAMNAFARPITITPTVSQPGMPPYAARGVWSNPAVEVPTEEGGFHSTNQPTLGICLADYAVPPKQKDFATVDGLNYELVDVKLDGQGGADLILRRSA